MRNRTLSRECSLKLLYQIEISDKDPEESIKDFFEEGPVGEEVRLYAERLIRGTFHARDMIDSIIHKYADNWDLKRMAYLDRNILRQAVYELLYLSVEVPPKVVINEAVNLAKKYSQEESGKFVNGVLDKINHTEERIASPLPEPEV